MSQEEKSKLRRYTRGTEWKSARGQWYVFLPENSMARSDGLVARSRLVMAAKIGRQLTDVERVLHYPDMDSGNDDPENLLLFPDQKSLTHFLRDRKVEAEGNTRHGEWERLLEKARVQREQAKEARKKADKSIPPTTP